MTNSEMRSDELRSGPSTNQDRGRRRSGPTSADDLLWKIVGIGRSQGSTGVAANKHKYLAEAYADRHT